MHGGETSPRRSKEEGWMEQLLEASLGGRADVELDMVMARKRDFQADSRKTHFSG